MGRFRDDDWWYYTPADPIPVSGGIRAKSQRGGFGSKWWGRRWVKTLESFVRKLRRLPIEVAALLQDEMPEALDAIVQARGLSLLPETDRDLETNCSCPDWSNPCKHIAAVYFLLAEAFDDDPFLLLRLRGMDREQLLAQLQTAAVRRAVEEPRPESAVPLPSAHVEFWGQSTPIIYNDSDMADAPPPPFALLGAPSFWRAKQTFDRSMTAALDDATTTVGEFLAFWEFSESD